MMILKKENKSLLKKKKKGKYSGEIRNQPIIFFIRGIKYFYQILVHKKANLARHLKYCLNFKLDLVVTIPPLNFLSFGAEGGVVMPNYSDPINLKVFVVFFQI